MNPNLWTEHETASASAQSDATAEFDVSTQVSPVQAMLDASTWTRADVELALHFLQIVLLAAALYYGVNND